MYAWICQGTHEDDNSLGVKISNMNLFIHEHSKL